MTDGTVTTDAGSADGTGDGVTDGTVAADAGSADGTGDGVTDGTITTDAGSADGTGDGVTDGTVTADAGSADGVSDGSDMDAGEEEEPQTDAGMEIADPCEDYECDEGYECVVDWGYCWDETADGGLPDSGTTEICVEDEVYCIEIGDAGIEEEASDAGGIEQASDAGEEEISESDAGEVELLLDGGIADLSLDAGLLEEFPVPQTPSCNCSTSAQTTHNGKWFLMGLALLGWRIRRKRS